MTRSIKTKNIMLKTTTLSIAIRNDAQQILKLSITPKSLMALRIMTLDTNTEHYNKMWHSA